MLMPGCTDRVGQHDELGVLRRRADHIREQWVVSVHGNIDLVGLQDTQVDLRHHRPWRAEHHVRQFGRDHRPAPPVGQPGTKRVEKGVHIVVVNSHVRAVQHLHVLPVDAPWCNADRVPLCPPNLGHTPDERQSSTSGPVVLLQHVRQIAGDLLHRPLLGRHTHFGRNPAQFLLVGNPIAGRLFPGQAAESLEDVSAVIRMRRSAGCDRPAQVACHDDVGVCTAHALLWAFAEGVDPARTHRAVATAQPERAIATLRLLGGQSVPYRRDPLVPGPVDHGLGVLMDCQACSSAVRADAAHRGPPSFSTSAGSAPWP